MTAELQLLTWCRAGEVIDVQNIARILEPFMVIRGCSHEMRSYHCAACDQPLANLGQLEMHVAAGGSHRLVAYCRRHGCYEQVDRQIVDHLAQLPVLTPSPMDPAT